MPIRIHHLALDGVADGPLGVGLDIVAAAARLEGSAARQRGLFQQIVSPGGREVRSGNGRTVQADAALETIHLGPDDVLVVAGLNLLTPALVDEALAAPAVQAARQAIAVAAGNGAMVAASCSAVFVVAASGVLDGGQATTSWWLSADFARRFPAVGLRSDRMVVEAGRVLTAGAALAHADLMLAVLARLRGHEAARRVAGYLLLDERPSQARYMLLGHLRASDPALRAVEDLVLANLARQVSLAEMAHAAAMSPRTLSRRVHAAAGLSPWRFAQRLRMARAAELLETTASPVEDVAAAVGYADPAAFRRVFRRETGGAPRRR